MAKLLLTSGFLFFFLIGTCLCLEFSPDGDTVKGATVSLVCTTEPASFTTFIILTLDGNSKTSCDNANTCSPPDSDATRYVYTSNSSAVIVTINDLNHTSDAGKWRCTLGTTFKDYALEIQTEPTVTTFINGSSTTPVPGTKYKTVKLSARSYCFFPSVSSANLQYSVGLSGSIQPLTTVSVVGMSGTGLGCDSYEFDLQASATVDIDSSTYEELSGKSNVYFQITFTSSLGTQHSTDFRFGPYYFKVAAECPLFLSAFLPVLLITLLGTIIVIVVTCYTDKGGRLKEGSMMKSCDCCPSENKFCMVVCPLCTDPLCKGSRESVAAKNAASVVVLTIFAAGIGIIIAYGLGLESGKCDLALALSIVCGIVLVVIFIVSVYPHWPCVPEKGENAGESGNQGSPKKDTQLRSSTPASATKVHVTTEYVNM